MELLLVLIYSLSSASALGSLLVIAVYARYKEIRSKVYNHIILNISIVDLLVAIGTLIGLPSDGSLACFIQSPLVNIGQVAQIFWVTVLAYYLYMILSAVTLRLQSANVLVSWKMYLLCYGVPVLVSFLPLTTVPFGAIDGGWCYIKEGSKYKWTLELWYVVSIFFWLYGAIAIYFGLFYYIYVKMYRDGSSVVVKSVAKAVSRIVWYPIALVVNYIPLSIFLFWLTVDKDAKIGLLGLIGLVVQLLQGLVDSIIFMITTPAAVKLLWADAAVVWAYFSLDDQAYRLSMTSRSMLTDSNMTYEDGSDDRTTDEEERPSRTISLPNRTNGTVLQGKEQAKKCARGDGISNPITSRNDAV